MRYRCNSCGGEYNDPGADRMAYFHACPPVDVVTVKDDKDAERELPLRALAGIELAADDADRLARIAAGARADQVYVELGRRQAPRLNARNENVLRRGGGGGILRIIKAEGKGRTEIGPSPAPPAPVDDAP